MLRVFSTFLVLSLLTFHTQSTLLPRADTPTFYLVASSKSDPANLLPLRPSGGLNGATLTGSTPPGKYFLDAGALLVTPANPADTPPHAFISAIPSAQGCTPYGGLAFVVGSSSNKCQRSGIFTLQANGQLGSKLAFQGISGFYACGTGLDIWFEPKPGAGPPDLTCNPVDLYTVPVV